MKPHYFEAGVADEDDAMLVACVRQGWVPPGCLLGGVMVHGLMQASKDPCAACRGPRHRCGGRPFVDADNPLGGDRGVRLGQARPVARGGDSFYFLGVDSAPSESARSDPGGLVGGRATPRQPSRDEAGDLILSDNPADWFFDFIYARKLTSAQRPSAEQWAAVIHELHERFSFERIAIDAGAGGGGYYVQRSLKKPRQFINGADRDVTPIADQDNGPKEVAVGYFILIMVKRGDPCIEALWPGLPGDDNLKDAMMAQLKQAFDAPGQVGLVPPPEELVRVGLTAAEMEIARVLDEMVSQFKGISVATTEGDTEEDRKFVMTKRGARQFSSSGKDDLAHAGLYCYTGFRTWLRTLDTTGVRPGDTLLFSGSR